jgi:hypothetical protein
LIVKIGNSSTLNLSIVRLSDVKPHEEIIPQFLDSIRRDMIRTQLQRDPILIDARSKFALDGMHRRAALESIGAKFALCSEYDYLSNEVQLERWLRYYIAPNPKFVEEVVSLFEMESVPDFREAIDEIDNRRSGIALLSARRSFVSRVSSEKLEIYDKVSSVDRLSNEYGIEIHFAPDAEKSSLFSSESVYVLYPVGLTKDDVLGMVEKGGTFPFKTTRHIVPIRPMGVYFPLDLLKDGTMEECEKKLEQIVNLSKIEVEPIDIWYEGRRYSEPLAVFRKNA